MVTSLIKQHSDLKSNWRKKGTEESQVLSVNLVVCGLQVNVTICFRYLLLEMYATDKHKCSRLSLVA